MIGVAGMGALLDTCPVERESVSLSLGYRAPQPGRDAQQMPLLGNADEAAVGKCSCQVE